MATDKNKHEWLSNKSLHSDYIVKTWIVDEHERLSIDKVNTSRKRTRLKGSEYKRIAK